MMLQKPQASDIREYIENHREGMIHLLRELVAIESPSRRPDAQQPVLDHLERTLAQMDFSTRRIAGKTSGGHLYARPASNWSRS